MRSQPIEVTLATLLAAKAAGVGAIMFTSDNFNKYPKAADPLEAMIEERIRQRSEEHTSELQSQSNLVCRLLLEKKKKKNKLRMNMQKTPQKQYTLKTEKDIAY